MKVNGWTEFICEKTSCVYNANKGDCFYPGRVKLNQKCGHYVLLHNKPLTVKEKKISRRQ